MNVQAAAVPSGSRYTFLDLFRGLAVLLMIEGHLVRLVLASEWKATFAWSVHEVLHGFTGPAFLFGSGFAFVISLDRKGAVLRSFTPDLWRRIGRAVLLILVGYALVVPSYSLSRTLAEATSDQWSLFFRFDALQLIGFTLLAMRLLSVLIRPEGTLFAFLAVLTVAVPLFSPAIWSAPVMAAVPRVVTTSLTGLFGSPFPVFPFVAYLTAGAVASFRFLRASRTGNIPAFFRHLLVGGLALAVLGLAGEAFLLPIAWIRHADASPALFALRLGGVMTLLSISSVLPPARVIGAWIETLGRESLFLYVCHLLLLYGSMFGAGSNTSGWFAASLTPLQSVLLLLFLLTLFSAAAWLWSDLRKRNDRARQTLAWSIAIAWIVGFVFF